MTKTDAKRASEAAWDAENTRRVNLKLNKHTDADILKAIDDEPGDSMQGRVKALLRRAIKEG